MSYPKAKINELNHKIEVLEKAFKEYPDNMDLVKTAENIKAMKAEVKQWRGLLKAQHEIRIKENVHLH